MNGRIWTRRWYHLIFCALLLLPLLVLSFGWSLLNLPSLWSLFLVASFCTPFALALLSTLLHGEAPPLRALERIAQPMMFGDTLPSIPRTLREVYTMGPTKFEIFSAAVLIAMGEGHRFLTHCGQSGDQGIDVKLRNLYHNTVVVQCKLYAPENHVGQPELRDFWGSILFHQAVYGFFVTTSTFTPAALQLIASSQGRIRPIDGRQLEYLLQHRSREIALALHEVLSGAVD